MTFQVTIMTNMEIRGKGWAATVPLLLSACGKRIKEEFLRICDELGV